MTENAYGLQEKKDARRKFLKRVFQVGGALGAAGVSVGVGGVKAAFADAATRGGEGQNTGPPWQAWADPKLKVKDGWDDWDRLLNPNNLPIYYDRFDRIDNSKPKHHWVMVMDLRKCIGCQACVVACKSENNVPLGYYRTWVNVAQEGRTVPSNSGSIKTEAGQYDQLLKVVNIPKICNHCDEPPCVLACPAKATFKRQDGPVLVDPRVCIGCGACVNACPYNARYINPVSHTADKCTFCVQRVDQGLLPACVTSCVGHARVFGDLLDPASEVSQLLAKYPYSVRKPEMGTEPQVFYIGRSGDVATENNPEIQHLFYTYAMNLNSTAYKQLAGAKGLAETAAAFERLNKVED